MKKNKFLILIFCILLKCTSSIGQTKILTLEDALAVGLKNNFDIQLAQNTAQVATNNNTIGNAGMLPQVTFLASTAIANNATKQEFSSGLTVDKKGVGSNNINAGVYLSWTLFDGLKMFATHEKLQELEATGLIVTKIQIESILSKIIVAYYDVVQQKQLIDGLKENIAISEERLKIAEKKFEIGSASKLEVLQAKTDLNAQTSALYKQQTALENVKISLNQILNRDAAIAFEVSDSIPVNFLLNYDSLLASVQTNSTDLQLAKNAVSISGLQYRETQSLLYPKVSFTTNYLFARAQNQAGFSLLNQNLGFNVGLNASYNLFNGWNTRTQLKNAKLQIAYSNLSYQNIKSQVNLRLLTSFNQYRQDAKILKLEEDNVILTKEAMAIALERFRIGSSNSLELKDVQKTFDDALVRLTQARYNAKVSETELMRLNGDLLK